MPANVLALQLFLTWMTDNFYIFPPSLLLEILSAASLAFLSVHSLQLWCNLFLFFLFYFICFLYWWIIIIFRCWFILLRILKQKINQTSSLWSYHQVFSTQLFSSYCLQWAFTEHKNPLNFPIAARSTPHDSGKNNQPELNAVSKASQFLSSRLQKGVTLRMPRLVCLMV